jgi:hypothetical protein
MMGCCEKKTLKSIPFKKLKGGELVYFVSKKGYGEISVSVEGTAYSFNEETPAKAPKSLSNQRYLQRVPEPIKEIEGGSV